MRAIAGKGVLMKERILRSQGLVSVLAVVLVAVIVTVAGMLLVKPFRATIAYCATMPDAVGLYVGNEVTQRGIKVGEVRSISPRGGGVRVEFTVDADHPLQGDVAATTVSDTLVADRRMEVNGSGGPDWPRAKCIDRTSTPKSISASLDALSSLAAQLDGGTDPAQQGQLREAIAQVDRATAGTGSRINQTITRLASALRHPETGIADVGALIDTLAALSKSITTNWGTITHFLDGFQAILAQVNDIWTQAVQIVRSLVIVLPWFNDIFTQYGSLIETEVLDRAVPFLSLVAANVGPLQKLINMIPVLNSAFRKAADKDGRTTVAYAAPRVALPASDVAAVCARVNQVRPGKCSVDAGGTQTDLSSLVVGLIGVPQ